MPPEPIFDLAHLGHMELFTPKPEESLNFFVKGDGHERDGATGRFGVPARL